MDPSVNRKTSLDGKYMVMSFAAARSDAEKEREKWTKGIVPSDNLIVSYQPDRPRTWFHVAT
jgi:hypothetical protein